MKKHPEPSVCSAGEALRATSEQSVGKRVPKNKAVTEETLGQLQRWVWCLAGGKETSFQLGITAGMV